MNIAGVVAEYNPFHNGHAYQLAQMRRAGATHIVAVMSGAFVQRGEPAILDKWTRAQAAVFGGADLVIELPAPFALSSAPDFAFGAISALQFCGVSMIGFGSESGDLFTLQNELDKLEQLERDGAFVPYLKEGMSYPRARQAAFEHVFSKTPCFANPNDLLALSYLRAAKRLSASFEWLAVKRAGASHDSTVAEGEFASASYLRAHFEEEHLSRYVPNKALRLYQQAICEKRAPIRMKNGERYLLGVLRERTLSDWAAGWDVTEGLEHRLYRAIREADTLSAFYDQVKTKRYPHARIRRIACCTALSITQKERADSVSAFRVLALNERGAQILGAIDKEQRRRIGVNFADLYRRYPQAFEASIRAQECAALCMPRVFPCGLDFTTKVSIQTD